MNSGRLLTVGITILFSSAMGCIAQKGPKAATKPKLVLVIVVDQFRQDYTTQFRKYNTDGLKELLTQDAYF